MNLALVHSLLGDDSAARRYGSLAAEFGAPGNAPPMLDLNARLASRAGQYVEAAGYMSAALSPTLQRAGGAEAVDLMCAALEDPSKASAAAARIRVLIGRLQARELDQSARKRVLYWYGMLGALDAAFDFANATLDHFARIGTVPTGWATLWLPEMAAFRRDPRFEKLASRLGLTAYWRHYGPPDGFELKSGRLMPHR
jgi:hypothetical protein